MESVTVAYIGRQKKCVSGDGAVRQPGFKFQGHVASENMKDLMFPDGMPVAGVAGSISHFPGKKKFRDFERFVIGDFFCHIAEPCTVDAVNIAFYLCKVKKLFAFYVRKCYIS
jgi:hypothetical protein